MFKGGSINKTMGRLSSKLFIYESVPPQKADSHHFKNMIFGAQQTCLPNCIICFNNDNIILNMIANLQPLINFPLIIYVRMGSEPPSPYEIKSTYLEIEYKDLEVYVNVQREK